MKVLLASEMRAADQAVFSRIGVPSPAVMEAAGRETAAFVLEEFRELVGLGVLVLAGGGNNGGDGFVVARTLLNHGLYVEAALAKPLGALQGDARLYAQAFLNSGGRITELTGDAWRSADCLRGIASFGIIIDALYGTGFRGRLEGFTGELVEYVNTQAEVGSSAVVAIDIPSGVETDTGAVHGPAVSANATVALQCLKPAHVLYPGAGYCGEIYVADIGISLQLPEIGAVKRELITEERAAAVLQDYITPLPEEHKGNRGHVLVIGGGAGHFGAPRMSAEAALICAAGLVTLVVPRFAADNLALSLRELMCSALDSDEEGNFAGTDTEKLTRLLEGKKSLVLGPGMGTGPGACKVLEAALRAARELKLPAVIDADGLNILAAHPELRPLLAERMVLTPHPGEMARLCGTTVAEVQASRMSAAKELSAAVGCWVALKGARTIIAGPDGSIAINPAAVPTLATAGSGDVLAGIIGALLARGFSPNDAAACAVFVHGCAGELAFVDNLGPIGTLAGDVLGYLPAVFNALLRFNRPGPARLRKALPGSMHLLAQEVRAANE